MRGFREFCEQTFYHGTTPANAASILTSGLDPKRYQSGMFVGTYVTPNPDYFSGASRYGAVLAMDIDPARILDVADVTDADLAAEDPDYRSAGFGFRNTLITRVARRKGFGAIRNGKEVVVIDPSAVTDIKQVR